MAEINILDEGIVLWGIYSFDEEYHDEHATITDDNYDAADIELHIDYEKARQRMAELAHEDADNRLVLLEIRPLSNCRVVSVLSWTETSPLSRAHKAKSKEAAEPPGPRKRKLVMGE